MIRNIRFKAHRAAPKPTDPAWLAQMRDLPGIFLPIRADTPGNGSHQHWAAKAKKVKDQRQSVRAALQMLRYRPPSFPLHVTLTRYGWQKMDIPNVGSALKGAVDSIAEYCGVDDGDDRWRWEFRAEKGRGYGLRILIQPLT